jgi:hypothetical protein
MVFVDRKRLTGSSTIGYKGKRRFLFMSLCAMKLRRAGIKSLALSLANVLEGNLGLALLLSANVFIAFMSLLDIPSLSEEAIPFFACSPILQGITHLF